MTCEILLIYMIILFCIFFTLGLAVISEKATTLNNFLSRAISAIALIKVLLPTPHFPFTNFYHCKHLFFFFFLFCIWDPSVELTCTQWPKFEFFWHLIYKVVCSLQSCYNHKGSKQNFILSLSLFFFGGRGWMKISGYCAFFWF